MKTINTLFVDDERSFLDQTEIFLKRSDNGIKISSVLDVEEALSLLEKENFDVIVSDYQMPEKNGLEFLKELREERTSEIPFIMFTGKGREEVAMKALNLGADRYLQKGGDPKSQFGVLSQAIKQEHDHHKRKKELEKSEKEKSIILKHTSDAIAYHDSEHNIIWANCTYLEGAGMTLEEMKGKKCYEAWYGRDEPCKGCPTDEALRSGKVEKGEISPPEGDRAWLITATPIKDKDGDIERIVESSLDITEIKEKEKKIKKLYEASTELKECTSESEIYEKVLKSAEDILNFEGCTILMKEKDDLVVKASKSKNVQKGEKYSKDEGIRGLTFQKKKPYLIEDISEWEEARPSDPDYMSAISIPVGKEGLFQALSSQKGYFDESDLYLAEILISDLNKSIERIRSQRELKKNTERYETLFKDNPEAIIEVNDDFEIVQVNEKFEDLFGYEEDEIQGRKLKSLIVPPDQINEAYRLGEQCEDGDHVEHETVRLKKDGEEVDVAITARSVEYLDERHHVIVYKDITEQKQKEKELKRKEKYIDHSPEYITVLDKEGNIKYHSYPSDEILEIDPSEFMGSEAIEFAHPDDREDALEMFYKVLENPGEEYKTELRGKGKDDWIWFEIRAVNHLDDAEVEGIIITAQDITKRKETEKEIEENKDKIERLHDTSAEIQACKSEEEIYSLAVEAAEDILDFDICCFDAVEGDMFVRREISKGTPKDGHTERRIDEGGLARKTYLNQGSYLVNDLFADEDAKPVKSDYRSAISVPNGEHGVFQAVSTEIDHFDEEDLRTAELLISHVSQAIERIQMKNREEFLHSLLRHDIGNKIKVIK